MTAFYLASQVRELDQRTMAARDISDYALMCDAGEALYRRFRERFSYCGSPCVLAGSGNNGGDGFVFARLALQAGLAARVLAMSDTGKLKGAARSAFDGAVEAGVEIEAFENNLPETSDCFIDAMLGTGLDRPVEGKYAAAIELLNNDSRPVVAVDIPSGLHADSGLVLACATRAAMTVTFIGRKPGLHMACGPDVCGEVLFESLNAPASVYESQEPAATALEKAMLQELVPARFPSMHKGDAGHVLVVGGGPGMPGACRLTAEAALRSGAGKVSVRAHPESVLAVQAGRPELMVAALEDEFPRADVLAIGPGLGKTEWSREVLRQALSLGLPTVLDADGLTLLAGDDIALPAHSIMTPHPGEAASLLGVSIADIQGDRIAAVAQLAKRYQCVAVLKGAGTVIASPDGRRALCPHGGTALATAGSGDVLTGVIAALLGEKLRSGSRNGDDSVAWEAACAGVLAHALAGEQLAGKARGAIASDIIAAIHHVLNNFPGDME